MISSPVKTALRPRPILPKQTPKIPNEVTQMRRSNEETHIRRLPVPRAMLLISPHRLETRRAPNELVRELGLVLLASGVHVVDKVAARGVTAVEKVKEAHVGGCVCGGEGSDSGNVCGAMI